MRTEWLPDPIYTEVREEEGKRFAALAADLKETRTSVRHELWPMPCCTVFISSSSSTLHPAATVDVTLLGDPYRRPVTITSMSRKS